MWPRSAARPCEAGADALSLINTINSIMGVDLDTLAPKPAVGGYGSHGGYCGPAVKPIALNMVAAVAADPEIKVPISGIGGIQAWQDAVEFLLLGAARCRSARPSCTMASGSSSSLQSGLEGWMREKGYRSHQRFRRPLRASDQDVGRARPELQGRRPRSIRRSASTAGSAISPARTAATNRSAGTACRPSDYVKVNGDATVCIVPAACEVLPGAGGDVINLFTIKEDTCVGCNMCSLVCPVEGCITMKEVDTGQPPMNWNEYQELLAANKVQKIEPPEHV